MTSFAVFQSYLCHLLPGFVSGSWLVTELSSSIFTVYRNIFKKITINSQIVEHLPHEPHRLTDVPSYVSSSAAQQRRCIQLVVSHGNVRVKVTLKGSCLTTRPSTASTGIVLSSSTWRKHHLSLLFLYALQVVVCCRKTFMAEDWLMIITC